MFVACHEKGCLAGWDHPQGKVHREHRNMRKTPLKVVSLEAILGCKDCRFVWSRRHAKCFVHVPRAIVVPSYRVTVPFISRVVGVKTCLLSTKPWSYGASTAHSKQLNLYSGLSVYGHCMMLTTTCISYQCPSLWPQYCKWLLSTGPTWQECHFIQKFHYYASWVCLCLGFFKYSNPFFALS